jgi:hypothetical protein
MSGEYKNIVGYSPSDFFFVSALDSSHKMDIDCANIDLGNLNANVVGNTDMHDVVKVYKHICENRDLVNSWTDHKINHAGSQQALDDSQTNFNASILNTVNLLVGIGFITWSLTSGWFYR